MNDATRTTMQAAPRHSASPRIEAIAAWLIAALILAGGGIVARLIVDYPQFLPNSYIGFLIYRAGPAATLLWACAGATITVSAAPRRPVLLIALVGSIAACFALSGLYSLTPCLALIIPALTLEHHHPLSNQAHSVFMSRSPHDYHRRLRAVDERAAALRAESERWQAFWNEAGGDQIDPPIVAKPPRRRWFSFLKRPQ